MIIYNTNNILELIDELSPALKDQEHKLNYLSQVLNPQLLTPLVEPQKPNTLNNTHTPNLIQTLKDSGISEETLSNIPQYLDYTIQIDEDNRTKTQVEDKYNHLCNEYNTKKEQRKKLLTASSKYLKGYAGWGLILDYYPKSTHLKYLIEAISISVSQYIKLESPDEPIHIKNFKKMIPQMVESYLIFGKATLNFSKIVPDEITVEDPTQIVNTSMLIYPNAVQIDSAEATYNKYRNLGWKDWDPINFVDVMRLPFLQKNQGLTTPRDIAEKYDIYAKNFGAVSMRYDLEYTIPIVGRKSIASEKIKLLGGDMSFLTDNLYYLATLELIQSIIRITVPLMNTWHVKDPAVGMSSLYENDNAIESDDISKGLEEVTAEGSLPVITTSTNGELRVNVVPLDHLPALYLDIIRNLYTKWGQPVPEQQSSLRESKLNSKKIEYLIENVIKFTYEKYLSVLVLRNSITETEKNTWLKTGIFNSNPRVDLRDSEEFSGYRTVVEILNSFEGLKLTPKSAKKIVNETLGFSVEFEKVEPKNNDSMAKETNNENKNITSNKRNKKET